MKKSIWGILAKWVLIIIAVIWVKNLYMDFVAPKQIDLTSLVDAKKADLEVALVSTMNENPAMIKRIYQYSDGEVMVESDKDGDVGIVYIDGKQTGLHIHGRQYFMYGVHLGDSEIAADNNITFEYTEKWSVLNDLIDGSSTAYFYTNKRNNDCMVVVINDTTGKVVALTYFNDYETVTKRLS